MKHAHVLALFALLALLASTALAADPTPVLRWTPAHDQLTYTFGGNAPVKRIAPGTRIVTFTKVEKKLLPVKK